MTEHAIEVFGWVAAVIGIVSNIPQLARILRARTSAGVSLRLWQLAVATTAAWCVHGYLVQQQQMQWPNMLMAAAGLVIVIFVLRDRGQRFLPAMILPVSMALALSLTNIIWGALVFGIVVAAPQLVGQGAQLKELITAPDLTGVSGVFLAIFLVVQSMWFTFGILTADWALINCAGAMVVVCIANLSIYAVRTTRAKGRVRELAGV